MINSYIIIKKINHSEEKEKEWNNYINQNPIFKNTYEYNSHKVFDKKINDIM